jgi:hypothetical protein
MQLSMNLFAMPHAQSALRPVCEFWCAPPPNQYPCGRLDTGRSRRLHGTDDGVDQPQKFTPSRSATMTGGSINYSDAG